MDILVNPVVSRLVDTLINLTNEELHLILGVPEEIQKLRRMLCSIQDVLNDAEQQQITRQEVKRWLSRLTNVMYDADDILDEYRIVAEERASQEHPSEKTSLGCKILPLFACCRKVKFTHEIGFRIRDLNMRLEEISAIRSTLDLRVSDRPREVTRVGRETSSDLEPDITGEAIEEDTRDLVELLLSKDEEANANVVVIAIVGIGGIGKTTLAQKIFSDQQLQAVFQKKIWVCVSQEFVETDLLREIITGAGGSPGEARSKTQLETKLKDVLKDKNFLLVLDDVWDAQIWEDLLRKPLQVGAIGSRVLVTTRNQRIAERMKAIHIHNVNLLSLDDSWLLLCKKITKNTKEKRDVESLKDIGMKIVKKCQGLPLAITTIGGVLCGEFRRWKWQEVEQSSAWLRKGLPDGVHEALYLSYQDLPSHLKQCFLYCSLFREDSTLYRQHLVQLWVAEGFVLKEEGEEYPWLEEIAQGYYDELIQRSLLQGYQERNYRHAYCRMHDLLRSLCHCLARGESLVIRDTSKGLPGIGLPGIANDDFIKLRRLSVVESEDIKHFLHLTQRHKSVRTLLLENIKSLDDEDVDNCFKNFQCLRVIGLRNTMIKSLPQSIENLLHLRYLNLSHCNQMMALPESIASLKNLQFLILDGCYKLRTLPKEVVELRQLRTLNLDEVPLEELPSGIARLEHLNVLRGAIISSFSSDNNNNNSCSLEEISKLRMLRQLSICKLGRPSNMSEQKINDLNALTALEHLVFLELIYDVYIFGPGKHVTKNTEEDPDRIEKIFDGALHPPSCVRQIIISGFFGRQFPRWLMSSSISTFFPNLTMLELRHCGRCSLLPPLGKLPNMEALTLHKLDAVTSIGAEFFGYEEASISVGHKSGGSKSASSSLILFPRLKLLHLLCLDNLEAWHWIPEDGETVAMPQLNELAVQYCPKLLFLPEGLSRQAICLTELFIGMTNLNSISGFPSIKKIILRIEKSLKIVSHLPALEELEVILKREESLFLPNWLELGLPFLTSLQRLYLSCGNEQLLRRCLIDGPDWPKIKHIPVVKIHDSQGNYITYIKHSSTFQTNII